MPAAALPVCFKKSLRDAVIINQIRYRKLQMIFGVWTFEKVG
jgi:hypothetical protein